MKQMLHIGLTETKKIIIGGLCFFSFIQQRTAQVKSYKTVNYSDHLCPKNVVNV